MDVRIFVLKLPNFEIFFPYNEHTDFIFKKIQKWTDGFGNQKKHEWTWTKNGRPWPSLVWTRHVPGTGFWNGASTLKQHFVLPKNGSKYYLKYTFLVFPVLGIFGLGTSLVQIYGHHERRDIVRHFLSCSQECFYGVLGALERA